MRPKVSRERDWTPYMQRALELAAVSQSKGDVPIGAVVLDMDGRIVGEAHNEREIREDPTAHAEVLAIRQAAEKAGSWRLTGHTVVVTLEPCVMCAGALSLARVDRIVFGASDSKAGGTGSLYQIHDDARLNHRMDVVSGVLGDQCRQILLDFFRSKRK